MSSAPSAAPGIPAASTPCSAIRHGKSRSPIPRSGSQTWTRSSAPTARPRPSKADATTLHDRVVEEGWIAYNARLKALSNFTKFAAFAFGDPTAHENKAFHFTIEPRRAAESLALHSRWRPRPLRDSSPANADPAHPFRYQGSADINTYKLFAEQSLALLRPGGRLGFILPSGIYSDKGSGTLRGVLLDACRWEWCFGFENREGIFDIHRSFKFVALSSKKAGAPPSIRTAFMRRHVEDWAQAETVVLDYPRALVDKLSPFSRALVEIRESRDVDAARPDVFRGVLFGDETRRAAGAFATAPSFT